MCDVRHYRLNHVTDLVCRNSLLSETASAENKLTMANVAHEPVKQAMNRIRQLSADDEARFLALARECALHDEVSFLNEARREGREQGWQEGRKRASWESCVSK